MAVGILPFKDPDETLDYVIDWSARLVSDTIVSSSWALSDANKDAALTIDSDSHTTTKTTIWLSGGTVGISYQLTNRVVTAAGRTMDQTVKIKIRVK